MKPIETTEKCCKKVQHSARNYGNTFKSVCGKPATHVEGSHFFCRHHSKTGRYVARLGDIGEVVARFDTEQLLKAEISTIRLLYPDAIMQKVTKSHRRFVY